MKVSAIGLLGSLLFASIMPAHADWLGVKWGDHLPIVQTKFGATPSDTPGEITANGQVMASADLVLDGLLRKQTAHAEFQFVEDRLTAVILTINMPADDFATALIAKYGLPMDSCAVAGEYCSEPRAIWRDETNDTLLQAVTSKDSQKLTVSWLRRSASLF